MRKKQTIQSFQLVDFTILFDHWVTVNEREKLEKYQVFARKQEKHMKYVGVSNTNGILAII